VASLEKKGRRSRGVKQEDAERSVCSGDLHGSSDANCIVEQRVKGVEERERWRLQNYERIGSQGD